jgi:SRSO17 transposase
LEQVARSLSSAAWHRLTWRQGSRGAQRSRFAMLPARAAHGWREQAHPPRVREWLLVEWPEGDKQPTKYGLAQLGSPSPGLRRFVRIAKAPWRIQEDYRELKEDLALDHYEGRQRLGWHHHVCLVTTAHALLRFEQARLKKTSGATWTLPRVRRQLPALLIRLSGPCAWCLTGFNDPS